MYVQAVLLPFKGQVIYDGLMQSYSVFFGGGIKGDLKEQYMRAKQRGEIITTFDPKAKQITKEIIDVKDWQPELEILLKAAKKLRGGAGQPAIYSPAFSLVKASLALALQGVTEPENARKLNKELSKVSRALGKVEDTIYRMY